MYESKLLYIPIVAFSSSPININKVVLANAAVSMADTTDRIPNRTMSSWGTPQYVNRDTPAKLVRNTVVVRAEP